MATQTETVRARIDPELKANTEQIFAQIGITTSDAIKIFLKQVEISRGIPFPLKAPVPASSRYSGTSHTEKSGVQFLEEWKARKDLPAFDENAPVNQDARSKEILSR